MEPRVVLSMACSCNKSVLLLTKTLPPGTEGPSTRGSSARSVPGARPPRTRKTGPGITGNSPSTATPAAARASRATRHTVSRLRSGRSAPAGWEHAGRGAAWVALWAAPSSGDEGCASQASRHGRRIAPAHRAPAHTPSGANAGRGQRRPWPAVGRRQPPSRGCGWPGRRGAARGWRCTGALAAAGVPSACGPSARRPTGRRPRVPPLRLGATPACCRRHSPGRSARGRGKLRRASAATTRGASGWPAGGGRRWPAPTIAPSLSGPAHCASVTTT